VITGSPEQALQLKQLLEGKKIKDSPLKPKIVQPKSQQSPSQFEIFIQGFSNEVQANEYLTMIADEPICVRYSYALDGYLCKTTSIEKAKQLVELFDK